MFSITYDGPTPTGIEDIYRAAVYRVLAKPPFDLRVGQYSDTLKALFHAENCKCAAFLTAFNPGGVKIDRVSNLNAQHLLESQLQASGIQFIRAVGLDPDPESDWPGEDSVLALNLSMPEAEQIGSKYRQKAILYCSENANPRLKMLER